MTKIEGYEAFAINWRESERGMGQRADGFSLHLSVQDAEKFKKDYGVEGDSESYSFPSSTVFRVIVDEATFEHLKELQQKEVTGTRRAFPNTLEAGEFIKTR